jgi:acetolactate synthase-1/2/3 large subunit
VPVLEAAISSALSAPTGPVSLEIPVDVQRHQALVPRRFAVPPLARITPDAALLDEVAALVKAARRPMLFLGGGARGACDEARALLERGFCAVTSTNGRAVVPENDPRNLGAFNMTHEAQAVYESCDLMIVVGSRLRGNETRNNALRLGRPLVQIDAEASQGGRNYEVDLFIQGEAQLALQGLLDRLPAKLDTDATFPATVAAARQKGEAALLATLGPYASLANILRQRVFAGAHPFVRDVTIANSTFGNRYIDLAAPNLGVHALGGGIGQGVAMSIGAAHASDVKTICLCGDGGVQLNLGEFTTAVDENSPIVYVLMNDQAYGVISNIQDAQYDGRHAYCRLRTPDFGLFAQSIGLPHTKLTTLDNFEKTLDDAIVAPGPHLIEIDMLSIGPFAQAFGGPPAGAAGGSK